MASERSAAVAAAVETFRFVGFSGMGHDLPRPLWPEFASQIAALAARGEQRRPAAPHRSRPAGD